VLTFRDNLSAIPPKVKRPLYVGLIGVSKRRYRANILRHVNAKTNADNVYTAVGARIHPKIRFLFKKTDSVSTTVGLGFFFLNIK